jgi:hypothetical protein
MAMDLRRLREWSSHQDMYGHLCSASVFMVIYPESFCAVRRHGPCEFPEPLCICVGFLLRPLNPRPLSYCVLSGNIKSPNPGDHLPYVSKYPTQTFALLARRRHQTRPTLTCATASFPSLPGARQHVRAIIAAETVRPPYSPFLSGWMATLRHTTTSSSRCSP